MRLYGEPATMSDGSSSSHHHTVGDPHAGHAISETLRDICDFDVNPKSLCNHYNQGDAVTRRRRHQLYIAHLNALLARNSRVSVVCIYYYVSLGILSTVWFPGLEC